MIYLDDFAKERFLTSFDKTSSCWIWKKTHSRYGYGVFYLNRKQFSAHRISFELFKAKIPEGLVIDHLCRVRECVNPDHLEPVTNKENILRGESNSAKASRQTKCKHGHPFDNKNTFFYKRKDGRVKRCCKECNRIAQIPFNHKRSAQKALKS